MTTSIERFATMSDIRNAAGGRQARTIRAYDINTVRAVPHIDLVKEMAAPWTVPEEVDPEAVEHPELVVPMTNLCSLAEVSDTDAPRFVKQQGSQSPGM